MPITSYMNYENGRIPPVDVVLKIVALTRVNPRWLLHGEGERLLPEAAELPPAGDPACFLADLLEENARLNEALRAAKRAIDPSVLVVPSGANPRTWLAEQDQIRASAEDYVAVPILSGEAAARPPGHVFEAENHGWALCPRSAIKHPKTCFAARVETDGMSPIIPQGSLAVVDTSVCSATRIYRSRERIVAVRDPRQGCVFRWIEKAADHWLFLPANSLGRDRPIAWSRRDGADSPIIGNVVYRCTTC